MFFRKKKYGEVEGYDRISRMIEDRQTEAGDAEFEEDLLEDDTVPLTRESSVSRTPPISGRETLPGHETVATDDQPVQESVTVVRAPERPAPAPRPVLGTAEPLAPVSVPTFESPRMPLPDLSLGSAQAGGASLVAKDAVWDGKLVCSGNVRIEGTLRGEIHTTGALFVAAEARVEGSVKARTLTLAGEIQGDVQCDERLEILPGGAARGEVDTGALVVHEGAFIESRFQMRREASASTTR